jgi:hypothetical protein
MLSSNIFLLEMTLVIRADVHAPTFVWESPVACENNSFQYGSIAHLSTYSVNEPPLTKVYLEQVTLGYFQVPYILSLTLPHCALFYIPFILQRAADSSLSST